MPDGVILADAEYIDEPALRRLQLERLRATAARAQAHNPHYRERFAVAGASAEILSDLAAFQAFPFTTKQDLRAGYPFGFLCEPIERIARLHASSGTTGQATVACYTAGDLSTWAALVARSLRIAGVRPGMRAHIAYGYGLFTGGLGAHYGAEALGCAVIPMSGGQTERQVQFLQDFAPEVILVTPSYMLAILDEFRRQGRDPRGSGLQLGVFGAEPWTEAIRTEIEDAFGIEAFDIYGLSEIMGPGVACEGVGRKGGPTLWEDHFYPEIIDPVTGAGLPDGAIGELVLTTLTREAMPVLRYRTRDLTRLLPGVASPMRRLDRILGRSDDMLIVRGVNVFPTQVEEQILKIGDLAPHFEIILSRPTRLDEMQVRVERRAGDAPGVDLALARALKEHIGLSVTVELCAPGTLERSTGKARRVRDLRG